jgi:hypothetical protein
VPLLRLLQRAATHRATLTCHMLLPLPPRLLLPLLL